MSNHTPIPGPSGLPFLGNILDIDANSPAKSLEHLADLYGPIYALTTFGNRRIVVSSRDLVDEVCNEDRFTKKISDGLNEVRNGVQDGLFTAHHGEHNWEVAHRVLVPAFGPLTIRDMFDDMYDIAAQLAMKWAREGSNVPIEAADDFTKLTLDTLALCAMGARFNSYYREKMHPFVHAMTGFLLGSGVRSVRPNILNSLPTQVNGQYATDIEVMQQVAKDLVRERRETPSDQRDILNAMLNGRDPKTGEGMTDASIVNNMITFLIAGHETTSGALSFLMYFLLKTPHAYQKLQEEIDRVVGRNNKLTLEHLSKLPYLNACIRESLRLHPTAPAFSVGPHPEKNHEDPILIGNGKYKVEKGDSVVVLLAKAMKDPAVWGSDAEEFKPERMLDEEFANLPKNAWKPFGNGVRGCIGRPFAWQEMLIVMTVLMQNFNLSMFDPGYDIQIKQTLTIKPKDFFIRANLRDGLTATRLSKILNSDNVSNGTENDMLEEDRIAPRVTGKPMSLYYGSNTGTCEALARRLASDAFRYGYSAEGKELDAAMQNLPRDHPVVIITASYEGKPPDNASHFFEWLSALQGNVLDGVSFGVFGCGHRDWQATFQKVPTAVDEKLGEHGGARLCNRGCADAATSDMYSDFDSWSESFLWPAIFKTFGSPALKESGQLSLDVKVMTGARASILGQQMKEGVVLESRCLTHPDVPLKQHLKFQLPEDMTYRCGDYLAILPTNPPEVVSKALRRFNLPSDAILEIQKPHGASLAPSVPLGVPVSVADILSSYVELSQPACKRDINILAESPSCSDETRRDLKQLAENGDIQARRLSPLDLLIKYPSINLSIGEYIAMLPPMRPRQYSISSSPLLNPSECTISFSVLSTPLEIDEGLASKRKYLGVASNYLSNLKHGDKVQIAIKRAQSGFKPPNDIDIPVVMACAGSGIAPFRGFIMDRAEKIKARQVSETSPAKAILYVGCRTQAYDDVYHDELAEWQALGAVEVRWAYSRPATPDSKGQYVQDRILEDQEELVELFEKGAVLFVCGSVAVGSAVRDAIKKVYSKEHRSRIKKGIWEGAVDEGDADAVADEWLNGLQAKQRFATDVFT